MEAEGEHDFVPNEPTELAFRKGDKMLLLNYGDPDIHWFQAEIDGRKGLVPENYIRIVHPSWYVGRISRSLAERVLKGNKNEGAFLVRLSESSPESFSLSVKCGHSVEHFKALRDERGKYFLWEERFNSLNELVEHYRRVTVSNTRQILLLDMDQDNQRIVEALYDFVKNTTPEDDCSGEIEFKAGELITVYEDSDDNWWVGSLGEPRVGYFPRSYTKPFNLLENFGVK